MSEASKPYRVVHRDTWADLEVTMNAFALKGYAVVSVAPARNDTYIVVFEAIRRPQQGDVK